MLTTPEQQRKLAELHWYSVDEEGDFEAWRREARFDTLGYTKIVLYPDRPWECDGDLAAIAEAAPILLPSLLKEREEMHKRVDFLRTHLHDMTAAYETAISERDAAQERIRQLEEALRSIAHMPPVTSNDWGDQRVTTVDHLQSIADRALGRP